MPDAAVPMTTAFELPGLTAVIAVRFDSSEIGGQYTEIVAYGTTVKVQEHRLTGRRRASVFEIPAGTG